MTDRDDAGSADDPSGKRVSPDELVERADADSAAFATGEMERVVSLLSADDPETRATAAEVLQNVFDRPELFESVVPELLAASASYPDGVEGVPSPQSLFRSERVRTVVYVADALARVAQRDPAVVAPHAEQLLEVVRSEANAPAHHVFSLGYVAAETPDAVPTDEVRAMLRDRLDRGHGLGYPSWAAHALGEIGDPSDLTALREAYPDDAADEPVRDAFDEAIAKLERRA